MTKIFISYTKKDKHLAGELKKCFEQHAGVTCFVAHDDILPGSEWEKEILRELREANLFMPLQTEHIIQSHWCQQEAGIAVERKIKIVPLIPQNNGGCDPVGFYSKFQGIKIGADNLDAQLRNWLLKENIIKQAVDTVLIKRVADMVLIPNKGSFLYGDDKQEIKINYDYYMDVFPVTNAQYQEFINERKDYDVPYRDKVWAKFYNWDKEKRTYPTGKEKYPVVFVSYEDAWAFCKWRSQREGVEGDKRYHLPTEEEWEKAASWDEEKKVKRVYPWGDEFDKDKCNTHESGIGQTTPVSQYPQGRSPYGCYDMSGNVWEWTESCYDKAEGVVETLRGGGWTTFLPFARCAYRFRDDPVYRNNDFGFRCARTL